MIKTNLPAVFARWLAAFAPPPAAPVATAPAPGIGWMAIESLRAQMHTQPPHRALLQGGPMEPYQPPAGVLPEGMALDYSNATGALDYATRYGVALGFPGYPALAELAQVSEYRAPVETLSGEMTRKWLTLKATGDKDRSEIIALLTAELDRLEVEEAFRRLIELDGFYGRGHLYLDLGDQDNDANPLILSNRTIARGSLRRLTLIEPMWTTPSDYNALDPRDPHFYRARAWYVMGKKVHDSRMLTIVSRPVPNMLRPAYNFGGISLSQLLIPYVNNWLRARQDVSDLISNFSLSGIKTNLNTMLAGGVDGVVSRAEMFTLMRDNKGVLLLDKDAEEFFQFNTPLSGLDKLQAQAQEQMAGPTHIPLVKLLGVTPSGLNASSDGEIQVFHEYIRAEQERLLSGPFRRLLRVLMLSLFGQEYDDIIFEWNPLSELSEEQAANVQKIKADTDAVLIEAGVISQEEVRRRIATDPASAHNGLDADEVPDGDQTQDPAADPA